MSNKTKTTKQFNLTLTVTTMPALVRKWQPVLKFKGQMFHLTDGVPTTPKTWQECSNSHRQFCDALYGRQGIDRTDEPLTKEQKKHATELWMRFKVDLANVKEDVVMHRGERSEIVRYGKIKDIIDRKTGILVGEQQSLTTRRSVTLERKRDWIMERQRMNALLLGQVNQEIKAKQAKPAKK